MPDSDKLLEMRRSNRRQVMKLVGAAGAVGLAGCSGDSNGNGEDNGGGNGGDNGGGNDGGNGGGGGTTEIRMITDYSSPDMQELLRNSFDAWAETIDQDVERSFLFRGFDEVIQLLNQGFAQDNPTDMALLNGGAAARYAEQGRLANLTEVVEKHNQPEGWRFKGPDDNDVFMPFDIGIATKWYHSDVYEEAGIEEASTFDEELNNAETLEEHLSDTDMDPALILSNANSGATMLWMGNYLLNNNTQFLENNEGEVSIVLDESPNRDRAITALEHLRTMYQYSPNSETYSYAENIEVNHAGQVAWSCYTGRLMTQALDKDAEDGGLEDEGDLGTNIEGMPFPIGPDNEDEEYRVHTSVGGVIAPKAAGNVDLVRDYIDFFFSEGWYVDALLTVPLHVMPPNLDLLENNERVQDNEYYQYKQSVVEYYEEWGPQIKNPMFFTDPPTPYWMDVVENSMIGSRMIAEVVTDTKEAGQAVDDAAANMRDLLSDYQ